MWDTVIIGYKAGVKMHSSRLTKNKQNHSANDRVLWVGMTAPLAFRCPPWPASGALCCLRQLWGETESRADTLPSFQKGCLNLEGCRFSFPFIVTDFHMEAISKTKILTHLKIILDFFYVWLFLLWRVICQQKQRFYERAYQALKEFTALFRNQFHKNLSSYLLLKW